MKPLLCQNLSSVTSTINIQRAVMVGLSILLLLAMFSFSAGMAAAREIVDMAGRKVSVPDSVKKVYVPSPYGSYLMYSIDPAMLISFKVFSNNDKRYLNKAVRQLPEIRTTPGQDKKLDIERIREAKPDLVIMWSTNRSAAMKPGKMAETLNQLNLPVVYVVAESLNDYPDIYLFLGKLLGREERTEKLSAYFRKTLAEVKDVVGKIPEGTKPSVYYAEGTDGLSTECNDSIHVELLRLIGDTDVHCCHTASHMGLEKISLEQVKLYEPDVVLAKEKIFYDKVVREKAPEWQQIKAVKEGRVYLIPSTPFNWFDRPPSFMRILGLKWLTHFSYPNEYKIDIIKEAREFYRLFLGLDLSDEEMKQIIYR